MWKCLCECGKTCFIDTKSLTTGKTTSCGCYRSEQWHKRITTHGESRSKLYYVWNDMKSRCTDCNSLPFKDYGGRGIRVCDEWLNSYAKFSEWAKENGYACGLTLDRMDVNGDYEPSNCRWVSMKVQGNNKRTNRVISFNGESHTLTEWSEIAGIGKDTIRRRLNAGWDIKDALTIKPVPGGNYGIKRHH